MKTLLLIFVCLETITLVIHNNVERTLPTTDLSDKTIIHSVEVDHTWKPANTTEEFFELISNPDAEIIRSVDDFLKRTQQEGTVYAKLNKRVIQKFTKELKFKNGGLSSAQYDIIEKSLSKRDYEIFWEGFGLSLDFVQADDHGGYACVGVGDCAVNQTHICTSNC
ncbi:hypothetical protein WJR50_23665 [Catalinimonas sp. 4WD22]|uniref:hypothetical protein n=1 Tax=Catalinimonas locisalis TaxID=3133978 RepID=UPI003101ADE5